MSNEKLLRELMGQNERLYNIQQVTLDRVITMSDELNKLQQEVAETRTVTESAVKLIVGMRDELANIVREGVDPAAVAALANELDASVNDLAVAVAANTKVDPVVAQPQAPVEPMPDALPEPPVMEPLPGPTEPPVDVL